MEQLENWGHRSTKIIIVSLPSKYNIINRGGEGIDSTDPQSFCDYIPVEKALALGIQAGIYIKPEFIMGMYDSKLKTFINNERYYGNLTIEEQTLLFEEVKENYIQAIKSKWMDIEEYVELLGEIGLETPLSREEIDASKNTPIRETAVEKEWKITEEASKESQAGINENNREGNLRLTNEFLASLNQTLLNQKVVLPNGNMVQASHYIEEIVRPLIPENGKFKLKNGIEISARQYIEEFVLGEGQTKYNGDIHALMQDTLAGTDEPPERDPDDKDGQGLGLKQEYGSKVIDEESSSEVSRGITNFEESIATHSKKDENRKFNSQFFKETLQNAKVKTSEVKRSEKEISERNEFRILSFQKSKGFTAEEQVRYDILYAKYYMTPEEKHQQGQKKGIGMSM